MYSRSRQSDHRSARQRANAWIIGVLQSVQINLHVSRSVRAVCRSRDSKCQWDVISV